MVEWAAAHGVPPDSNRSHGAAEILVATRSIAAAASRLEDDPAAAAMLRAAGVARPVFRSNPPIR